MNLVSSVCCALAMLAAGAHAQEPRALKFKLNLLSADAHGATQPAKNTNVHLSGPKLIGSGNYQTSGAGELKLSLAPGDYMLDVLGGTMCHIAVTIKAGADVTLALRLPPKSDTQCVVVNDLTEAEAAASEPTKR